MNLFFLLYPSRILWAGGALLMLLSLALVLLIFPMSDSPVYSSHLEFKQEQPIEIPSLHLHEVQEESFPMPSIESEVSFSLNPSQPGANEEQIAAVFLQKTGNLKRVVLPGRFWLSYDDWGALQFEEGGPFWVDLSLQHPDTLIAKVTVLTVDGEISSSFSRVAELPVIQRAEAFPSDSPLRILAEGRWLGKDLISWIGLQKESQRIELGSQKVILSQEDYLLWKEGSWVKSATPSTLPLARIRFLSCHQLEWDVWDEEGAYQHLASHLHDEGGLSNEEPIRSLRIRSAQQCSGLLGNQSLLLRLGDWVLKEKDRWRILRKEEERNKLISGQLAGDLLIIEKIDWTKKLMQGQFIDADRVRSMPIESIASHLQIKRDKRG